MLFYYVFLGPLKLLLINFFEKKTIIYLLNLLLWLTGLAHQVWAYICYVMFFKQNLYHDPKKKQNLYIL